MKNDTKLFAVAEKNFDALGGNPFSTKNWLPGTFFYRFATSINGRGSSEAEEWQRIWVFLGESLQKKRHVFQIVGSHGSGKSTFLESFAQLAQNRGFSVCRALLNQHNRTLPNDFLSQHQKNPPQPTTVFLLDGFEQLSFWGKLKFRWCFRRYRWRHKGRSPDAFLIFSTHRPIWFVPVLHRTVAKMEIFLELARTLQPNLPTERLQSVFAKSGGNFRNAFFELYDECCQREQATWDQT